VRGFYSWAFHDYGIKMIDPAYGIKNQKAKNVRYKLSEIVLKWNLPRMN
jgi:hypothetical protein